MSLPMTDLPTAPTIAALERLSADVAFLRRRVEPTLLADAQASADGLLECDARNLALTLKRLEAHARRRLADVNAAAGTDTTATNGWGD